MTTRHDDRLALRAGPAYERVRFTDDRLEPVLGGRHGPDLGAVLRWPVGGGDWDQAASGAGRTAVHGQRVRRKLKRLRARQRERAAAARSAAGGTDQ